MFLAILPYHHHNHKGAASFKNKLFAEILKSTL